MHNKQGESNHEQEDQFKGEDSGGVEGSSDDLAEPGESSSDNDGQITGGFGGDSTDDSEG